MYPVGLLVSEFEPLGADGAEIHVGASAGLFVRNR